MKQKFSLNKFYRAEPGRLDSMNAVEKRRSPATAGKIALADMRPPGK
ncbi:MAG: hypothetical protein ACMX3H_13870 [Sodalis sp. (in: enterobacteria)]